MDDLDDVPRSLPCSAEEVRFGMPPMVQLQFVNAGLEKHPYPREDFYRQYAVTPERQTPIEDRTPPPPVYSPRALAQMNKDYAQKVAKSLKRFYAGRVMLKMEEADQHGDFEDDADYWDSKTEHWQHEILRLMKEMGKRKKQELKGEAEEGYAKAMLFSPLQSPSSSPLRRDLPEVLEIPELTVAISSESPAIRNRPSPSEAVPSEEPLVLRPEHSPHRLSTVTKGQKRKCSETEDQKKETLENNSRVKRQRKGPATAKQKQEPVLTVQNTQNPEKNTMNTARTKAKKAVNMKGLLAEAQVSNHILPWKLRSRNPVSHRETGTKKDTESRSHQATKKFHQRASRRHVKCLPGRIT